MQQVRLGNKIIGDGQPTFVIAEMAWSHDGSVEKAKAIINGASKAGADAISVHITSLKDYMVRDYGTTVGGTISVGEDKEDKESIYNYLDKINLKDGDWEELFSYAKSLGLAICAMPNDIQSLRLCERLGPDSYVIAAACFAEEYFVSEVAREKKAVVLRIGGATLGEIENTINLIREQGTEDIVLLHGFQLYPTRIEHTKLRMIPSFKAMFGLPVGLADHIDAEDSLATVIPLVALASGATVIEKHLTHNRKLRGEDFVSAFNPEEFKKLVEQVRGIEKAFGSSAIEPLSEGELRYRKVSRKRAVASRPIGKGAKIAEEDIVFKRSDGGIYPDETRFVIGRTADQDIEKDDPITWDKIL